MKMDAWKVSSRKEYEDKQQEKKKKAKQAFKSLYKEKILNNLPSEFCIRAGFWAYEAGRRRFGSELRQMFRNDEVPWTQTVGLIWILLSPLQLALFLTC